MAENIKVIIRERRAQVDGGPVIVCGNSDYTITFDFDGDWNLTGPKTARFVYVKDGEVLHEDKVFSGKTVAVPVLSDVSFVDVGVFAGDLCTTTPARIRCKKSILCGSGEIHEPTPDVYAQIMALFNEMAEQGAFGATEAQAQQIEANKTDIAALKSGTNKAGMAKDADKLGGTTAEVWDGKIDKIRQSVTTSLSVEGWYRLTPPKVSTYGSFILSFYNTYSGSPSQSTVLVFDGVYQGGKFFLIGSERNSTTTFDKVRLVQTSDGCVVDVHYTRGKENPCTFVMMKLAGTWSMDSNIQLVATEPADADIITAYDIPSDAQLVLDKELEPFVAEKLSSIKTTQEKTLSAKGWYRIADGVRVESTTLITLCNLYNSMGADAITLLYQCSISGATYKNPQITLLGSSSANQAIFTNIRVVKTSDGIGVDVYYNQNVENNCQIGLLNLYSRGKWKTCDVVPIEDAPEESSIVINYSIPKNAQLVLNTELAKTLANYLPLNGGGEINGPVQFSNAHNLVTSIVNTSDVPAYIAYHGTDGFLGALGFGGKNTPVFYESDYNTPHHLLHDGNSAKVAIQSTAPADGLWVW